MKILILKSILAVFGISLMVVTAYADIRNTLQVSRGKVLIVLSSQEQLGQSQIKTGVWLPDATHPYFGLTNGGYEVDFASPMGGAVPVEAKSDPRNMNSMNADDAITRGFLSDQVTVDKLASTKKLSEVQAKDYAAIVVAGGMAAMYDLPTNADLKRVIRDFWEQNKVISAIHYGVYGLLKMTTGSGKEVLRGVELTAVSREEEQRWAQALGWDPALLSPNGFLQDQIKKEGAGYKSAPSFTSYTFAGAQKHFLTAQQSFSGMELGIKLAKSLEQPLKPYTPKKVRFMKMKSASR